MLEGSRRELQPEDRLARMFMAGLIVGGFVGAILGGLAAEGRAGALQGGE